MAALPQESNRRAAPRKVIREPASIVVGEVTTGVRTWDIGRDGMSLLAPRPISPGSRCRVTFELPLADGAVSVTAAAKVVYSSYSAAGEFKIGALFIGLDDEAALLLGRFTAGS
jgi:PilZ domain-containing protein